MHNKLPFKLQTDSLRHVHGERIGGEGGEGGEGGGGGGGGGLEGDNIIE